MPSLFRSLRGGSELADLPEELPQAHRAGPVPARRPRRGGPAGGMARRLGWRAFETKAAEGLVQALCRGREMTQWIHDAVRELRDDDSAVQAG